MHSLPVLNNCCLLLGKALEDEADKDVIETGCYSSWNCEGRSNYYQRNIHFKLQMYHFWEERRQLENGRFERI